MKRWPYRPGDLLLTFTEEDDEGEMMGLYFDVSGDGSGEGMRLKAEAYCLDDGVELALSDGTVLSPEDGRFDGIPVGTVFDVVVCPIRPRIIRPATVTPPNPITEAQRAFLCKFENATVNPFDGGVYVWRGAGRGMADRVAALFSNGILVIFDRGAVEKWA